MRKFLAMAWLLSSGLALSADDAKKRTLDDLQGTWLIESASMGRSGDRTAMAWTSKLVVAKESFAVENFLGLKKSLKGTIQLDPEDQASHVDLAMEEFDLKEVWPVSIPKAVVPAIYKFDGVRLELAFFQGVNKSRPKAFDDKGDLHHLVLVKAPAKFADFPKEIAVKVVTADGKPAEGVSVVSHFGNYRNPKEPEKREWSLSGELKTDAAGIVRIAYAGPGFAGQPLIAWDRAKKLMGIGYLNPVLASAKPEITIEIQPEVKVNLNIVCDELKAANKTDVYHCYAESKKGIRLAFDMDKNGKLEFPLPAGEYKLRIYGGEFIGSKQVPLIVPRDRSEYTAPEIKIPPTGLLAILNKPAPELTDIVG